MVTRPSPERDLFLEVSSDESHEQTSFIGMPEPRFVPFPEGGQWTSVYINDRSTLCRRRELLLLKEHVPDQVLGGLVSHLVQTGTLAQRGGCTCRVAGIVIARAAETRGVGTIQRITHGQIVAHGNQRREGSLK